MERDDLKGKQTPGEALLKDNVAYVLNESGASRSSAWVQGGWESRAFVRTTADECRANAALYAEAHNVANETNMWPREMQERIKKLEEASNRVMEAVGAVNQYRKEKNNPNLPKPLNSDMQTMWKELQDANNALAKTLRPHLFATPSTIN